METKPAATSALRKRQIILAYRRPLVSLYCFIRFLIIRINIIEKIHNPISRYKEGRVLDIGCGFGLFALYNASRNPSLEFEGFDLNQKRIRLARNTAETLRLENIRFAVQDARESELLNGRYKVVYMLDILHHIPVLAKYRLLRQIHEMLDDDGILIIKDIDTRPVHKLLFTWLLDRIMCPFDKLTYQSHKRLAHIVQFCGFSYSKEFITDILPYPHICFVCRKQVGRVNSRKV